MLLLLMVQRMLLQPKQLQQLLLQDEILSSIFLQGFKGIFNSCFLRQIQKLCVIVSLLLTHAETQHAAVNFGVGGVTFWKTLKVGLR
jgi:hypothetical protein